MVSLHESLNDGGHTITQAPQEFARWEDKFFEQDKGGGYGKPVIKDKAVENEEQGNIATELRELMSGEMYIKQVDANHVRG